MSVRGPGAEKEVKKKKKNAFWTFFLKREKELRKERNGGGEVEGEECVTTEDRRKELMTTIGPEWERMTTKEKERYRVQAEKSSNSEDGVVLYNSYGMRLDAIYQNYMNKELAVRDNMEYVVQIVDFYKGKGQLAEMPIVICQFGTFAKKVVNGKMRALPSEVALVAFSMRKGILLNLATLIMPQENDYKEFSKYEVKENCEKFELIRNSEKELQDYKQILQSIDDFLLETVREMVLFCNEDELEVTSACLQWLCDRAGGDASKYEVLSLPHFALKYAIEARYAATKMDKEADIGEEVKDALNLKKQLVGGFLTYPHEFPWIESIGIFVEIGEIREFLNRSNYTYNHQLSCSYHMEVVDGCQFCPLSLVNRYALALMDVLLRHFPDVMPLPGKHYPRMNDMAKECLERRQMLRKWTTFRFINLAHRYKEKKKEQEIQHKEFAQEFERARLSAEKSPKFTPRPDPFR